jgi:acyl carrier protein
MIGSDEQLRAVVERVLQGIAPEADVTRLAATADLRRELDLDSVDMQNVVIGIIREAGVDVPDREVPRLTTLRGWIEFLRSA